MMSRTLLTLRSVLLVDAGTCAAMGALLTIGSGPVGQLTQIPSALLFYAGFSLFPIAAFMAMIALHSTINATATWLIIVGNALWVAGSFLLLSSGWIAPNYIGSGVIVTQAIAVAVLTFLEHLALRESLLQLHTS